MIAPGWLSTCLQRGNLINFNPDAVPERKAGRECGDCLCSREGWGDEELRNVGQWVQAPLPEPEATDAPAAGSCSISVGAGLL